MRKSLLTQLRFRSLVLLLTAIVMLLSSCNKEQDVADVHKRMEGENPNPGKADFTIRFLPQWHHQAQFAGVYMAFKKGFYSDYGINVEILAGGPDRPAYESVSSGITDVTQLFLLTALTRDALRNNLVNLAQISQKSSLMLIGKKARGINTLKDFNHKKIGLWRTDFRELSLIFLEKNKLDMNIINVDSTINLFLNDVVDVMNVMRYNEYHQMIQAGINEDELFTIPFSEYGMNIIEDGLYTTREFYQNHPTECRNFAEATMDGWLYAINHQEETLDTVLDIMRRHHIRANRAHQAWMLREMREVILAYPEGIGELRESDFTAARNLLLQQQLPATQQKYQEFYPRGR